METWAANFGITLMTNSTFRQRLRYDSASGLERNKVRGVILLFPTLADVAGEMTTVLWVQIVPLPLSEQDTKDRDFERTLHNSIQDGRKHRIVLA
jgi:hypothetical protein